VKLATWNVNSLTIRLPRLLDWLAATAPDVICLQETKLDDPRFPAAAITDAGYNAYYAGQRTYNGVALLARRELGGAADIVTALPDFADDSKRVLAATVAGMRIVNFYVPNGQAPGTDKYAYKLAWCDAATRCLAKEAARAPRLVVTGDFNIAPEDRDVHDPALWSGQIMCSEPEREKFRAWTAFGLADSFRMFEQPPMTFSWWDYRQLAFPKNRGLRIDHILLSRELAPACTSCRIDRNARKGKQPSDHAPVIAELAL